VPIEVTYFCIFSSTVPAQLVPSISQAFHDGMARVAASISDITSAFNAKLRLLDEAPSPIDCNWGSCCGEMLPPLRGAGEAEGLSRLKEFASASNMPSVTIQACQGLSSSVSGATAAKGWCPRTLISWMMKSEANGA